MIPAKPGQWLNQNGNIPAVQFMPQKDDGPPIPIPDGKIIVRANSGLEHTYELRDAPRGWRDREFGLAISTLTGWMNFPWRSIFSWELINNSTAYHEAAKLRREWVRAQHSQAEDEKCEGDNANVDRG